MNHQEEVAVSAPVRIDRSDEYRRWGSLNYDQLYDAMRHRELDQRKFHVVCQSLLIAVEHCGFVREDPAFAFAYVIPDKRSEKVFSYALILNGPDLAVVSREGLPEKKGWTLVQKNRRPYFQPWVQAWFAKHPCPLVRGAVKATMSFPNRCS